MYSRNSMTRMSYGINLKLECKILTEKIRCRVTSDKSQMARTVVMRKGKGGGGQGRQFEINQVW